jgi:ParE toxin of type II toxin-antitoxin system, parDE
MNFEVISDPTVKLDLIEIVRYYDSVNKKYGTQFLERFQMVEQLISDVPFGFAIKYKNVRTIKLKQFPYLVHYFLYEARKQAVIIAITHTSRKPFDYTKR